MVAERAHPRRRRVRRRGDFERAYGEGGRRAGRGLVVFARGNGLEESRLGVTATRRFGNAVQRNRARRVIREAFRHVREQLPSGYDFVVVARRGLARMSADELRAGLVALAREASGARET